MGRCRHCGNLDKTSNLFKVARNFGMSVINVMKHAAKTGGIVASKEVIEKRLEQCKRCEHRMTRDRCKLCGCFLHAKTGLEAEKCPDGRW